jgi:hypothetical protein
MKIEVPLFKTPSNLNELQQNYLEAENSVATVTI